MNSLQGRIEGSFEHTRLFAPVQNQNQIKTSDHLKTLNIINIWEEKARWHPGYQKHLFLNFLFNDGTLLAFGPAPTCHKEQSYSYIQKPSEQPSALKSCSISKLHAGARSKTTLEIFTKPNIYILRWPFDAGDVVHISAPKDHLSAHERLHIQNSLAEFT